MAGNFIPCVPYEFSMAVKSQRDQGTEPHVRITLDRQGAQMTMDYDHNDFIGGQMPPRSVSSNDQPFLHVWERLVTMAEPLETRLTDITCANPTYTGPGTPYYDTRWDAGVLRQVPFPEGKLPAPSSRISNYGEHGQYNIIGDALNITWNTTVLE